MHVYVGMNHFSYWHIVVHDQSHAQISCIKGDYHRLCMYAGCTCVYMYICMHVCMYGCTLESYVRVHKGFDSYVSYRWYSSFIYVRSVHMNVFTLHDVFAQIDIV